MILDMPVLRSDHKQAVSLREALVGRSLETVVYRQTEHGGLTGVPDGLCHEVDLDVVLRLSTGGVGLTWDRDDLVEGISVSAADQMSSTKGVINVDVGQTPHWRPLLGQPIRSVSLGWQTSEEGCPESLWSVRLDVGTGGSVVIALGELDGDARPSYFPDGLLVIFAESIARSYSHLGTDGTAWADDALAR
ncbi:hypothetical protein ODJ79_07720 [Actinoplanes sp. KI2]|uniref:hypothetical protein n=1 Tax=Actinoplanes sp. KI2 TaxID=2983315 RepID=UPI0021D56E9C|nr:hypothetical protein [Actinoplanes sp. KI2]MCU7723596.1 hypothetical protein [Actinoplanes sp. KI2]